MKPGYSGQLLFEPMRSSAPASCASASIGPSVIAKRPAPDQGAAYLEEAVPVSN